MINGTLTYTSAGSYAVIVTASDGTLSASQSFAWTVTNVDRAPVVAPIANQTSAENTSVSLPVTATDQDGDTLTYTATGLPPGLGIGHTSGVISGSLSYASAGVYTPTVTASDGTLKIDATGLAGHTRYFYRFVAVDGAVSPTGQFVTAPRDNEAVAVRFAFSGDTHGAWRPYPLVNSPRYR